MSVELRQDEGDEPDEPELVAGLQRRDPDDFLPSYGLWGLRPDVLLMRIEDEDLVRRGFDALPDHYREVLSLKYFDDKKTKEVAEVLGITEHNVKIRVHRACAMLRRKVRRIQRIV